MLTNSSFGLRKRGLDWPSETSFSSLNCSYQCSIQYVAYWLCNDILQWSYSITRQKPSYNHNAYNSLCTYIIHTIFYNIFAKIKSSLLSAVYVCAINYNNTSYYKYQSCIILIITAVCVIYFFSFAYCSFSNRSFCSYISNISPKAKCIIHDILQNMEGIVHNTE